MDRVFIERFLEDHNDLIRGRGLEVKSDALARRFGSDQLDEVDVLDIDAGNGRATIVGDLSDSATLAASSFDCFVFTQTVQYVPDVGAAMENAYRALRPGGTLLITVPTIARVDPSARDVDRWRLRPEGCARSWTAHAPKR